MGKLVYISKEKLNQLYWDDDFNPSEIAKMYGIYRSTVHKKLNKYNIPIKTNTKLSNKKELEKMYLVDKLSTVQIAKLHNTGARLVARRIIKFNIPRRSGSESISMARKRDFTSYNEFKFNKNQKEIFEGLMLFDGSLSGAPKYTNIQYTSKYQQTCKYKEFLEHIQNVLPLGYSNNIRELYEKGGFGNDKKYRSFRLESKNSSTLLEQRTRWYPNGKKIVPKDFKLTPISLLYCFLGDGCYGEYGKYNRNLGFSTQSFTKEDNEFLQKQLLKLGIKSTLTKRKVNDNLYFHYTIRIRNESISSFFLLIGKSPVECYKYKWGRFKNIDQIIKWRNAL